MASESEKSCEEGGNDANFKTKIIIIGAGIAGLSAANHLIRQGIPDFKILEARNRVGGRVVCVPLGNQKIELGANWIHGVLGNPIYELALSHKLIGINLDRKEHNVVATTEQGKRIPFAILEVYEAYYTFLKRCERFHLCKTSPPSNLKSVGDHLQADIDNYLRQFPTEDQRLMRTVFEHLLSRESCITGSHSMHDVELSEFGSYIELPGGNVLISEGFSSIIHCLTGPIPKENFLLNHTVKTIVWDPVPVSVECENGCKFQAEHVLVTVPLGVLKERVSHMFEPSLPESKVESIQRLLFGTVNKIFLEYERPFLHPQVSEVIILWDAISAEERQDTSKTWFRKIFSFSKVTDTILLTWLSGKDAVYAESLSAEDIAIKCTDILRKFLNDPYIPKPKTVVRTRWNSEMNTRGSYTAIGVGASQRDIENLAEPVYANGHPRTKPVLLFAGEATHKNFYSTTHGAFLSGRTAVQLLMDPAESPKEPRSISGSPPTTPQPPDDDDLESSSMASSWIQGISLE